MNSVLKIDSSFLKYSAATLSAIALAACGSASNEGGGGTMAPGEAVAKYEVENDHAIGSKDAPVVIVEYASVVCPACANWHNNVFPELKEKYVETGKVRFIFREFPTPPEILAQTGFSIANCVDESKFFSNIAAQFKRQQAILRAPDKGKAYEDLAKASGLSLKKYEECRNDQEWLAEYKAKVKAAREKGVGSTPTFFVNDKRHKNSSGKGIFTVEDFDAVIGPLLGEKIEEPAE